MKKVFILRHADSIPGMDDKARPLSKEGRKELKQLVEKEQALFREIDRVLCSSSARTRETLEGVSGYLPDRVMISYIEALYHASPEGILEEIGFVEDQFNVILVVGHNPGVTKFMHSVCEAHGQAIDKSMKTASIAEFSVQSKSWQDIRYIDLKFIRMVRK